MKRFILCIALILPMRTAAGAGMRTGGGSDGCQAPFRIENTTPRPIVRVGCGDMLFETANWYKSSTTFDYRYIGHFFAEIQYPILGWLGIGLEADYSSVRWDSVQAPNRSFSNICLFSTVRFNYYRRGRVEMYSGLGYGFNINTGTELDYKDRYTAAAPLYNLTLYGISVGCRKWFASFELGALASMCNPKKELYMLGSRLFSISIGFRL